MVLKKIKLEDKNSTLISNIDNVGMVVGKFDRDLGTVLTTNNVIRSVYGLYPIDNGERSVGVGGLSIARGVDAKLSLLDRRISFEEWKLRSACSKIADKKRRYLHTPLIFPVKGRITSPFGVRVHPILERSLFHRGVDIANRTGTFISATADGTVIRVGHDDITGIYVKIRHGYGYTTLYAHLSMVLVKKGDKVKRFQHIATLGNTGRTTGPHVHYEVRKNGSAINPELYMLPNIVVD